MRLLVLLKHELCDGCEAPLQKGVKAVEGGVRDTGAPMRGSIRCVKCALKGVIAEKRRIDRCLELLRHAEEENG